MLLQDENGELKIYFKNVDTLYFINFNFLKKLKIYF